MDNGLAASCAQGGQKVSVEKLNVTETLQEDESKHIGK